ncbi:MAG: zinc ribbon domain-containing protein [Propionibacteriaceae bacterium]|nr:zinc ribbon domain-containing protein [Propionibacteriaceae bacterium]
MSRLLAVPHDDVLVTCPRCGAAIHVRAGIARCLHCAWAWETSLRCRCQGPGRRCPGVGVPTVQTRVEFRCQYCGRVTEEVRPLQRDHTPVCPTCTCGTPMYVKTAWYPWMTTPPADHDQLTGLPFHLRTRCVGEVLWAANLDHVAYLESWIGALHRPRKAPGASQELGYRLPRWMLLAKNRPEVLRGLARLRQMAEKA